LATALVELKRWTEARPIFEKIAALDPANFGKQQNLMYCYLALKDHASYRRVYEAQLSRLGKTQDRLLANDLIWYAGLIPNAVRNYGEVIEVGRRLSGSRSAGANEHNTFGAVLYRAGQYSSSLTFLKKSIDGKKGKGNAWDWVFTAMARHRSGQPGDRQALDQARKLASDPALSWSSRLELTSLLEEAENELELPAIR
jgi:tetratricopeptide (TPR) repeat protein